MISLGVDFLVNSCSGEKEYEWQDQTARLILRLIDNAKGGQYCAWDLSPNFALLQNQFLILSPFGLYKTKPIWDFMKYAEDSIKQSQLERSRILLLAQEFKRDPAYLFDRVVFVGRILRLNSDKVGCSGCQDTVPPILRAILECFSYTETENIR